MLFHKVQVTCLCPGFGAAQPCLSGATGPQADFRAAAAVNAVCTSTSLWDLALLPVASEAVLVLPRAVLLVLFQPGKCRLASERALSGTSSVHI